VLGKLEFKTPVVIVAPPQRRVKVCPSSPKKKHTGPDSSLQWTSTLAYNIMVKTNVGRLGGMEC